MANETPVLLKFIKCKLSLFTFKVNILLMISLKPCKINLLKLSTSRMNESNLKYTKLQISIKVVHKQYVPN